MAVRNAGLHVGRLVHARRHAVGDEIDQDGFLALRRVLQQFDQFGDLLGARGLRGNALGGAFCTWLR